MRYTIFTMFILAILTISSCGSESDGTATQQRVDYNYLASAFCKCAEPTIKLNQELHILQKTNKQAFLGKLKEAGNKAKESMNCCRESMKNHTQSIPNANDLRLALKSECDGLPSQMLNEIVRIVSEK